MPTAADIALTAKLLAWSLIVGIVPRKHWRAVHRALSGRWSAKKRQRLLADCGATVNAFEQALGRHQPELHEAKARDVLCNRLEDTLFVLREYWPGGWNPKLRLEGLERLEEALARGRGVLFWVAGTHNRLGWKKALHSAGIRNAHLSRPEHGFSESAFAVRYLNPVCTNVESRFVERIVIDSGGEVGAVRRLRKRLQANQVVSVQDTGKGSTMEVPFLSGFRSFYVGAPSIALRSGAALLPLFTLGEIGDEFVVEIGREIAAPQGEDGERALELMIRDFAQQLGQRVQEHPERWFWQGWTPGEPAPGSA